MDALFKRTVAVLSVRRYSFKDDAGKLVEGCKVEYVMDWDPVQKDNDRGVEVLESNMPYAVYDAIYAPSWYTAGFVIEMRSNKPVLVLDSLEHLAEFVKPKPGSGGK